MGALGEPRFRRQAVWQLKPRMRAGTTQWRRDSVGGSGSSGSLLQTLSALLTDVRASSLSTVPFGHRNTREPPDDCELIVMRIGVLGTGKVAETTYPFSPASRTGEKEPTGIHTLQLQMLLSSDHPTLTDRDIAPWRLPRVAMTVQRILKTTCT